MSQQARVGLLVLAGILLFMLALFAIANRSFLFSDTFFVKARFNEVAGLQPGAAVQFQGVNVGRVESIALPETADGPIVVTMAIKEEAQSLVHASTQAQIKSEGLVGNMIIVLVNPAQAQLGPPVEEGEFINGVNPFNLFEITDKALSSVQTFEEVAMDAQQIMLDIQNGEGTLGKLIYDPALYNSFVATTQEAERTLSGMGRSAEQLVAAAENATAGVNSILAKIDEGEGTLARLLNDPTFYDRLVATSDTLQNIAANMRAITSSAEHAANWAALGSYRFAELMEAAKHNFLFKGYFEDRGYYEKAPFEVRESAIEQSYQKLQAERRELQRLQERLEQWEADLQRRTQALEQESVPATNGATDGAEVSRGAASQE